MTECINCKANTKCIAAAEPGSIVCVVNRLRYCGTHDEDSPKPRPAYCQYCGHEMRVIDNKRFCNNVRCLNRYVDI